MLPTYQVIQSRTIGLATKNKLQKRGSGYGLVLDIIKVFSFRG
jgi:hypothetical protein